SYAATERHAARIADVGARLVPYATTLSGPEPPPQFTARDFHRATEAALRETGHVLPQVLDGFAGDRPDLVLHDATMAWWGRLAAAAWEVPVVAGWPNLVGNRHWSMNRYIKVNPLHPRLLWNLWRGHPPARRPGLGAAPPGRAGGRPAQPVPSSL